MEFSRNQAHLVDHVLSVKTFRRSKSQIGSGQETNSDVNEFTNDDDDDSSNLHIDRKWVWNSCCDWTDSIPTFDIVTYNILSDFFIHPEEGHNPHYPKDSLTRDKREKQLMKELEHNVDADVFCLQEVDPDYFPDVLEPFMRKHGFHGNYMPEVMGKLDGLATFYKVASFDVVGQKSFTLNSLLEKDIREHLCSNGIKVDAVVQYVKSQCVAVFTQLRCKKTGNMVTIAHIHGLYGEYKKMDLTVMQIATAVRVLKELAGSDNQPYILCGDFNQYIDMPGYHMTQNGKLNEMEQEGLRVYPKVNFQNEDLNLIDIVPTCFEHSANDIKSSYKEIQGKEPEITYNGHCDPVGALDYIWYGSNGLTCCGVLDVVSTDILNQFNYCPNPVFPSDHLLMRSKFTFS